MILEWFTVRKNVRVHVKWQSNASSTFCKSKEDKDMESLFSTYGTEVKTTRDI